MHYWNSEDESEGVFHPKEEDNFCFNFQFTVGEGGVDFGDSYQILICTPKWIMENERDKEIINMRHRLIVFEYNLEKIVSYVKKYIARCSGQNYDEIAPKIGRLGFWEFEDYQP